MAVTKRIQVSGTQVLLHFPSWNVSNPSALRGIIACHGHTGSELQMSQGQSWGGHPEYWADKGAVVGMIATGDTWASTTAMSLLTTLWTYMSTTLGIPGRFGMAGWSMGGLHILRWTLENMPKVAVGWSCSPASDLDWGEASSGWTAQVDAVYGGSHATYLTQGSPRSPMNNAASFRGGPKFQIAHATDDAVVPYSQSQTFASAIGDGTVSVRQPDIIGGHQGGLLNVPPRESWEWLRTHWIP